MTYFCTEVNIPGASVGYAYQRTPLIDAPIPGDKMVYSSLNITFIVDEELRAWTEILTWIKGYSFPENTDQYKNLSLQQKLQLGSTKPQYSDATIIAYSNKNNPLLQIAFKDLFPIQLSDINFNTKLDATNVISGSASFLFTNHVITRA